mmetsp:Transcript_524/g.1793  ORF Transcript_524/g.1793 Transcript_524/m.1793 type:complete len:171 (+) Transcript_524:334-846(+)|eukprot:CAMPEP_0198724818 /NCGR_PEP_ID=MMETSP1475-20131203/2230_1 /TAXON_ID= ORGANISM="Unidentified sp., Strain CCMP1999" /NCGR_SAMPLE_ID=MMETSP1475 /ASSEMBLY_ACC=CAM_ASM_001111 /LENGTH=170 /DNA_ID=CAMNT_0044486443 /DNA_START=286 /DNA_END=798 /DNA_ORIENTATION=+
MNANLGRGCVLWTGLVRTQRRYSHLSIFGRNADKRKPISRVGVAARKERQRREREAEEERLRLQQEAQLQSEQVAEAKFLAAWATSCMLPWERAQMNVNKTPLKTWEKIYWAVFPVLGVAGFIYEMRGSNSKVAKLFRKDKDDKKPTSSAEKMKESLFSPDFTFDTEVKA